MLLLRYFIFLLSRYTFASGSADNIKQWKFPDGVFLQNLSGHNAIINSLAANQDGVLVSAGQCSELNSLCFWIGQLIYHHCTSKEKKGIFTKLMAACSIFWNVLQLWNCRQYLEDMLYTFCLLAW